jgi:hypothetical protein
MAKKERPRPEKLSVYLYIPNIVGGSLFLFSFFFLSIKDCCCDDDFIDCFQGI